MTTLSALVFAHVLGATSVWLASPMDRVFPDTPRPEAKDLEYRLYMARGEYESFQILLRTEDESDSPLRIETESAPNAFRAPEILRVGFVTGVQSSPRAMGAAPLWPDPLYPIDLENISLHPNRTHAFWVTYHAPETIEAGIYRSEVTLHYGKRAKKRIRAIIEVFDFTLPKSPTLATLFQLDRSAIRRHYKINNIDLEPWKALYDSLGPYRLSYSVWNGSSPPVNRRRSLDMPAIKAHVEAASSAAAMNSIDIAPIEHPMQIFPPSNEPALPDPLQQYLFDMTEWLSSKRWDARPMLQVAPVGERTSWAGARNQYFRVRRADKRVSRILKAPLHPYFERYCEIWAAPLRGLDPNAIALIQAGRSLATQKEHPAELIATSSDGIDPRNPMGPTVANDLYDGSLFSAWFSDPHAEGRESPWIRIDFPKAISLTRIRLAWAPGYEAKITKVSTSRDGDTFTTAGISWQTMQALDPNDFSWSEGEMKYRKTFRSIRLAFTPRAPGKPIGLLELSFGRTPQYDPLPLQTPVELWLDDRYDAYPSLRIDAHPVEFRLLPWVCWARNLGGFTGGSLTSWPAAWGSSFRDPDTARSVTGSEAFLFYPGKEALLPSIRAMLLRDGMEDYEYLTLFESMLPYDAEDREKLLDHWPFLVEPPAKEVATLAQLTEDVRVRIGRALSKSTHEGEK